MNVEPEHFNVANNTHKVFANKLIDHILEFTKDEHFDVVIDMGSGSGNVTEILAKRVKHNKILGLDIDPKMIEFAKQHNNTDKTIEYIQQDLCLPWDQLKPEIRSVAAYTGRVGLVFSNSSLMMMYHKRQFIDNVDRLMAKNSLAFMSTVLALDLNAKLNDQDKTECEKWIKIPSPEDQLKEWTDLLTENGFTIEMTEIKDFYFDFQVKHGLTLVPMLERLYSMHCVKETIDDLSPELREQFKEQYTDQIINSRSKTCDRTLMRRILDGQYGKDTVEVLYKQAFIIVRKTTEFYEGAK